MTEIEARGLIAVHDGPGGPVAALRGLDLRVRAGEIVAVVGPSGSGKTTLLRLLAGVTRPTAGSLTVRDLDLHRASTAAVRAFRRTVVATVDQHYRRALSPYLPVAEVVALPLAVRGMPLARQRARAAELLEAVGLADRGRARLAELSGGEQQRVAVAAALAIRPAILLADEPTGELDPGSTDDLLRLLRGVIQGQGATAVIVTHDPAVEAIADRVIVLEDGRAVATHEGKVGGPDVPLVDSAGWRAPDVTWRHRPASAPVAGRPVAGRPAAPPRSVSEDAPAIRLRGVTRRYGARDHGLTALSGVDVDVPTGGVHALVGPSGSGKSTLLRIVAGLDRPDAGRVEVLGTDLATLDRDELAAFRALRIGVAEQARGLVPFLEVRENIALAASLHRAGMAAATSEADIDGLLDRLGIGDLARRRPHELSAGERTRVAIGRALVAGPQVLLLDEPTATLDRVTADRIAALLAMLGRDRTVLVATHDPALIAIADDSVELGRAADHRTVPAAV
ncbi:MAG: transporter ATP-binding protein [Chloroflexi bacterium]|nr:transporter ATP-binding protein [Chloroflexota bacterium]